MLRLLLRAAPQEPAALRELNYERRGRPCTCWFSFLRCLASCLEPVSDSGQGSAQVQVQVHHSCAPERQAKEGNGGSQAAWSAGDVVQADYSC
jgi:hypothetical protein